MKSYFPWLAAGVIVLSSLPLAAHSAAPTLTLEKGDHICLIGNTLAERMQHHGNLETLLYSRFSDYDLVFRNLGFSGDELTLRLRSANFGSPDEWLTRCQADVVLAMFGYNESFADEAGLDKFKQDLDTFVKHTLSQKYNGHGAPRLVLFSPIAHEDQQDPNLPDGRENNGRIKLYVAAMAEVAAANNVPFIDLFELSQQLYSPDGARLTINGIHLNERGDQLLASSIERALLPNEPFLKRDASHLEKIRAAVLDKNFYWFNRYRTTDGYSIYGGRADLKFYQGQTNRVVAQREMEVLDVMTANRDRHIWAVAQDRNFTVDDGNTPEFIPVITNKPGAGPNGAHIFLSGADAIDKMTVHPEMKVNLYASEEMFPELVNPVQMAWDPQGRLWVAAWESYPHWKPKDEMNDKLLILEDTDGDGKADVCKTFADHLHNPTGFEFWGGGVIVAMAPDLLFLKDTDGDGRADYRERIVHGLDSADTHHTSNSFAFGPDGAVYFQEGTFHHTQVETPYGAPQRCANAGVFRYHPVTKKFEVYVTFGFANPHGHVFDRWGQDIVHDGTGAVPYHAALFSGHLDFPQKHSRPPTVYQQRTRPCPATEILSSRHFPDEMQDNLLVGNVIGVQGILQYKINDNGSSFSAEEQTPILTSSDPNFRPVDIEIGPDGAIYFTDWQNPIIGHMQHNLRDPSRDRTHGRVYRVTYQGRPLSKSPPVAGQPVEKLLDLFRQPENRVRYRTQLELSGRDRGEVLAATKKWAAALDKKDPQYERLTLQALWVCQQLNGVDENLLRQTLESPDFHVRAAATHVLCDWRDEVSSALQLLRERAADEHPRVRLEAVRAASYFTQPEAVEIPLIAAELPSDKYLDYSRGETLKALDPIWKAALARGEAIPVTTEVGARFFLRNTSTEKLLTMDRSQAVNLELLFRPGLRDEIRREALAGLSKLDAKPELRVLLDAVRTIDNKQEGRDESVVFDLVRLLTGRSARELAAVRGELEQFATSAQQPIVRQVGYLALIAVDGSAEQAWQLASRSLASLSDLLAAMPLISDASVRASLYPRVEPLINGLPPSLSSGQSASPGVAGRYVRIELPGRGTLTLAEVEVYSGGVNVARKGKASQKNTASGGDAARAIDGNKGGAYGSGGQTHTVENTPAPWWEVDLGAVVPIESIVIYNRTDGALGKRLDGFTLKVLSGSRAEVYVQQKIPAPSESVALKLGTADPAAAIRPLAMNALTSVRGQETKTFQKLAGFVRQDQARADAIRALQRIPRTYWPQDDAAPLVDVVLDSIRKTPAADRTSPAALDALEFADALAALLPVDRAREVRAELRELGVRVVRLGTLPERMSFDKEVIAVRAGKPVEFLFENSDLMPHNFVIVEPGSLEEVGLLAEATGQGVDAAERQYIPRSNKVMLASRLLQPRDSQKLSFLAPSEPGVYPYVCTYPGHWRRMYGAMYVVEDLDAYLANPEAYLAASKLPIRDDLLKDRRPRTEWKFEDLAIAVEELEQGRSYGNGKQMFQVAGCVSCHKLEGVGNEFGPDLTKLDAKFRPADILREMLDPSLKINEKYQTTIFELDSGKVVTGLILEETPQLIRVIENPLAKAEPIILKPSSIESRQKSPVSLMPKGLLDKLTRDEILELIAYVAARGVRTDAPAGGHQH